ncbi:nuclear transport factor 2 family protein [Streptomyces sp. NPDC002144]
MYERGDTKVVDRYIRPDLIQHDPTLPDGTQALKNLAVTVHQQYPDATYDIKRVISEGDLVMVHSHVVLTPGTRGSAVVDLYRFEGGRIAEHWDVRQDVPATSVNGNDMFSTISQPRSPYPGPRSHTAYNKKVVTDYYNQLFGRKDLSAIDTYVDPVEYDQHNATIPNGPAGAKAGLGALFQQFPNLTAEPKRIFAEGDLVVIHQYSALGIGDRGSAIVDIFRLRKGKIVEHWDVIQSVPETSANDNTMF